MGSPSKATQHPVFRDITRAMQNAEELSGPEGEEYIAVMLEVAALATGRAFTYAQKEPQHAGYLEERLRQLCDRLHMDRHVLATPPAPAPQPTFGAGGFGPRLG